MAVDWNLRVRIRSARQNLSPSPDPRQPVLTSIEATSARKRRIPLGASSLVALGILISRITGLARETAIAHFFGASLVADAFRGAFRIPNMLNNLFGEGVLSASFITVYAKLRASGKEEEARRLAEVVFGLLAVVCSVLVLAGILLAPVLTRLIVPGWSGEQLKLTIRIVRILFPGTGALVFGAWCLGVLNSHRNFLLPYVAPVAANLVMVAALFLARGVSQERLVLDLAWSFVLGSLLQFLVQLPTALRYLPAFRPSLENEFPAPADSGAEFWTYLPK